ncbi:MAG: ribosome maturation factor RimM [Dissulfurispiraceae bacterium]|jgi:16S rRNA processing protein RimM|nr:ribosome maturation factor RimM [Dissulfurispiraceae bacterium]
MKQDSSEYYLAEIGMVSREWGLRGELLLKLFDFEIAELDSIDRIIFGADHEKFGKLCSVRQHKGQALVKIEGIDSPEDAKKLRGAKVSAYVNEKPALPEGVYLYSQIIGLEAKDPDGTVLGKVVDIIRTGSNDVYVVDDDKGQELLVPAIKDVVRQIDLEKRLIVVAMQEIAE